ncbi:hypothetical protein CCP3SC15_1200008 [Gammaproteobacteria bacterium]
MVIVNPESGVEMLSREEVINIFLGRYRKLPSGIMAQPIDQADQTGKALFYKLLVGKELSEINSYWARLIFSGKTKPPPTGARYPRTTRIGRDHPWRHCVHGDGSDRRQR